MGKDGALRLCGRMRSRLLWSAQPPECPYPASVSLQNLLVMRGRPAALGAVLGSASREKTGEAEHRAQNIPALIAGAGQSPALGLGSARQLNQQIISRARAGGLAALPFPAVQPGVNPFIHISKTQKLWGLLGGRCCCRTSKAGGAQGAAPRQTPALAAVASLGAAVPRGEPSVPCLAARLFTSGQPDDSASLYYQLQKPGS